MLKTLILLGLAGGAAYLAYNQWFKKPSTSTSAVVVQGVKTVHLTPPSTEGLSGSHPINVF